MGKANGGEFQKERGGQENKISRDEFEDRDHCLEDW